MKDGKMVDGKIRVVLADDHPFILLALRQLILAEADFELVGEARTGIQALSVIRSTAPDLAIIDVTMPEMNGILLAKKLRDEVPLVKIIVLTATEQEGPLKQALEAGASGYVLKKSTADSLVPAIRAVIAGGTFVDPSIVHRVPAFRSHRSKKIGALTDRESEALKLTALGHSTKEIAIKMEIGAKSVETYRSRASEKLGLKSKAELVQFAINEGWFS